MMTSTVISSVGDEQRGSASTPSDMIPVTQRCHFRRVEVKL
jgi:hypothetical protein